MRSHSDPRGAHGCYFRALLLSAISGAALAQIGFDDVTFSAGIGVNATESFGASWGKFNADAYPDLYAGNQREPGRLWRNNGDGTFTDISSTADVSKAFGPLSKPNEQNGGYHRWSQNYSRIHVGLTGNTAADVTIL